MCNGSRCASWSLRPCVGGLIKDEEATAPLITKSPISFSLLVSFRRHPLSFIKRRLQSSTTTSSSLFSNISSCSMKKRRRRNFTKKKKSPRLIVSEGFRVGKSKNRVYQGKRKIEQFWQEICFSFK